MPEKKQESEGWFERYAREQGLDGWEDHHPDLGQEGPRPDYRLTRGEDSMICEVKEFRTKWLTERLSKVRYMTTSAHPIYRSVRNAISDAAKNQLRPYRGRGEALVIVLANPLGADVPLEDPHEVLAALYGDPAVQGPLDPATGAAGPFEHVLGRGGALTTDHQYISAIVTLHRRTHAADHWDRWAEAKRHKWEGIEDNVERGVTFLRMRDEEEARGQVPDGDYLFVRVFETKSSAEGHAVRLSANLFNGAHDQRWVYDAESGSYVEV